MYTTAYLVAWLDLRSGAIVDAGVYLERSPSSSDVRRRYPALVHTFAGGNGAEARASALAWVASEAPGLHRFIAARGGEPHAKLCAACQRPALRAVRVDCRDEPLGQCDSCPVVLRGDRPRDSGDDSA